MRVHDLVPPILLRARSEPRYPSYAHALATCDGGYQSTTIADVVAQKTSRYRDTLRQGPIALTIADLRTAAAVTLALTGPELRVVDVGGACGAHYFLIRTLIANHVRLHWRVVETPAMTEAAHRAGLAGAELSFAETPDGANREADLVFCSGALQYTPDPLGLLRTITQLGARHIALTRTALSSCPEPIVSVQTSRLRDNGPGPMPEGYPDQPIRYPVTFVQREAVESVLRERYTILARTTETPAVHRVGRTMIDHVGYVAVQS